MPRETDEDLLRLISEVHTQSPHDVAEARFSRAVDETERRTRIAAKRLSALTDGRAAHASDSWGLGVQSPGPTPDSAQAEIPTENKTPLLSPEAETTAVFHPPERSPAPRELTRRVRQLPGGHVESGSGRELKRAHQESTQAQARTPVVPISDKNQGKRDV